ncbi:MAG: DUF4956 domain-containing protein [Actinomycetota bacterium]|nr:DUF4956 domain-containing protein [Actinomycetota bacterium]
MDRITFRSFLESLNVDSIQDITQQISLVQVVLNLVLALAIAMFIYWIYKITFSGVLYSKNFNITLVLVSLVTTSAVMIIASNIVLALGMVGALSIVRFRMAVKDPKDVGFLFWAITNGIICGISAYALAIICALFIGLVIFVLSKKLRVTEPYLLLAEASQDNWQQVEGICQKLCQVYKLRSKNIRDNRYDLAVEVKIKKDNLQQFISEVKNLPSMENIKVVSYEGDLEEG